MKDGYYRSHGLPVHRRARFFVPATVIYSSRAPPINSARNTIQRALDFGAFTAKHVRKICESESALALVPPKSPVQMRQPALLHSTVEQRPLTRYVEVVK
jgi:hypothetical protein